MRRALGVYCERKVRAQVERRRGIEHFKGWYVRCIWSAIIAESDAESDFLALDWSHSVLVIGGGTKKTSFNVRLLAKARRFSWNDSVPALFHYWPIIIIVSSLSTY